MQRLLRNFNANSYLVLLVTFIVLLMIINIPGYSLTITSTIVVAAGQTYDGGGQTIYAQGMGDGSQDEGQSPIFKLETGATLRNVRIGAPGCDGVHCYGNNLVENVVWEDVGEDALTVKGDENVNCGTVTIRGCSASHAEDKVFQINAPCTFRLENVTCDDFGKVIRQNGDTTFQVIIYIDNCTFTNGDECIARTDSSSTQLYYSNMNVSNVPTLWIFPSESQIHAGTISTEPPVVTPVPTNPPAATSVPTATPAPTAVGATTAPTNPPGVTADPTTPPATGCTCANLCSSQTSISVPFTKDGAGEFCYVSSSLASYVNSWNTDSVNINGTNCTNTYITSSSIANIGGMYYIYYKGSYGWSHLEIK